MPAEEKIHRVFAEKLILKKGKICTVCAHRERAAIDLALARGVAVSALARRYDLGTDSIYRHRRGHVAEECGDSNMVCRVTGQLHQNLELTGKLLSDLGVGSTTVNNVLVMHVEMRSALVNALADFPEARQAVAAVLHQLEARVAEDIKAEAKWPFRHQFVPLLQSRHQPRRPDIERCSRSWCDRAVAEQPGGCRSDDRSWQAWFGGVNACRTSKDPVQYFVPIAPRGVHTAGLSCTFASDAGC